MLYLEPETSIYKRLFQLDDLEPLHTGLPGVPGRMAGAISTPHFFVPTMFRQVRLRQELRRVVDLMQREAWGILAFIS